MDISTTAEIEDRFVRETGLAGEFAGLVEPVLADLGMRLVRVVVSRRDGNTVQIMAERLDGSMSVDDCAMVSREISPLLDAYDPMDERYNLEISSPGIGRPLVRRSDFIRWNGFETKVKLREPIDGRKRFTGIIEGYEDNELLLRVDIEGYSEPQIIGLAVQGIEEARLVVNDALLKSGPKAG
jgi:ribosome maturation factor RimP